MSDDPAGPVADTHRSRHGCLCYGSAALDSETTPVSPFVAWRALGTKPQLTRIVFCQQCGFRVFDRGLSAEDQKRYYTGYRNDSYRVARNRFEQFYCSRPIAKSQRFFGSVERRQAVAAALADACAPPHYGSVLDFGGGDGVLISDMPAAERAVFDLSVSPPVAGVRRATADDLACRRWDLIVCARVLEHVSDPRVTMAELADLLVPGGWLYLEVPNETWENRTFAGRLRDIWIGWLIRKYRLLIAADTLSTACRILFGSLPLFGFIPMREHLQFFTTDALAALVRSSGCHRSALSPRGMIKSVASISPTSS